MSKVKMIMLVGVAGCGKTSYAQFLEETEGFNVHSSDKIRLELFGDEGVQTQHEKVFNELHNRIIKDLKEGKNTLYDATNISRKNRMHFLKLIQRFDCEKICKIIATPIEVCKTNNQKRNRNVPEHVINRMVNSFQLPVLGEGWDKIDVLTTATEYKFGEYFQKMLETPHDHPMHQLSIGEHMLKAYELADDDVKTAALVHDFGKIYVKTFQDKNGNETNIAHYYSHDGRGTYELMSRFYNKPIFFGNSAVMHIDLDDLALVQYHMYPLFSWTEKNQKKWKQLLGENLFDKLIRLNKADVAAH